MKDEPIELIHGSDNVFRDFGRPDADVMLAKALLASQIIKLMDRQKLTVRGAHARTRSRPAEATRQLRRRARMSPLVGRRPTRRAYETRRSPERREPPGEIAKRAHRRRLEVRHRREVVARRRALRERRRAQAERPSPRRATAADALDDRVGVDEDARLGGADDGRELAIKEEVRPARLEADIERRQAALHPCVGRKAARKHAERRAAVRACVPFDVGAVDLDGRARIGRVALVAGFDRGVVGRGVAARRVVVARVAGRERREGRRDRQRDDPPKRSRHALLARAQPRAHRVRFRISPSCDVDATRRPSRENTRPRTSPREPRATGESIT